MKTIAKIILTFSLMLSLNLNAMQQKNKAATPATKTQQSKEQPKSSWSSWFVSSVASAGYNTARFGLNTSWSATKYIGNKTAALGKKIVSTTCSYAVKPALQATLTAIIAGIIANYGLGLPLDQITPPVLLPYVEQIITTLKPYALNLAHMSREQIRHLAYLIAEKLMPTFGAHLAIAAELISQLTPYLATAQAYLNSAQTACEQAQYTLSTTGTFLSSVYHNSVHPTIMEMIKQ